MQIFKDRYMDLFARLPKLSLVQKIMLGFAAMAFFTMAALVFSFAGLYSLNKTAREIAGNDLVLLRSVGRLRQSLLDQERFAGKYEILKSPEFIDLFHKREVEFLKTLQEMQQKEQEQGLSGVANSYRNYDEAVRLLFLGNTRAEARHKDAAKKVIDAIDNFGANQQLLLNIKLGNADQRERSTIRWALIFSLTGFGLAVSIAALFLFSISTAIDKLKRATHRIAEGDFDYDPQIAAGDEIGDLAHDFISMGKRLKILEQMNLDASPLTRLPGNIVIERVLTKRLQEGKPFAVCYGDLDDMKAYNDVYGYIKGSEVIKMAGDIILEAVQKHAEEEAFVGHIGGDDFVAVFDQEKVAVICEDVIRNFDKGIVAHYRKEDLERGAIEGTDRYGVPRVFPIMTISIAVVICRQGEYDSAVAIAQTAAQIKDYVKGKPGSNYMINQRRKAR
ncbi:MAG TPA: HAMP domain-containing protein [Geobacteraceae bacterium]